MNRKISHKLILSYLAVILLLFFTFTMVYHRYYRTYHQEQLQQKMMAESATLSQTLSFALDRVEPEELEALIREFKEITGARVTVIDPTGLVLAETETDRLEMDNHLGRIEFVEAMQSGLGIQSRRSDTVGEEFLYVARPVLQKGQPLAYVRIAMTMKAVQNIPRELILLERLSIVAVALIALLAGALFSGGLTRPVREMTRVVEEIAKGNFTARAQTRSQDELGILALGINRMAQRQNENLQKIEKVKGELEVILNHLNTAVVLLNEEGKIGMINARAAQLFAREPQEALGLHHLQLIRDYALDKAYRKAILEQEVQILELKRYLPDLKFLEVVVIPVKDEEGIQSAVVSLHDITQIRMAEQIRTEFVANASHELKTPLTTIKGFAETLLAGALDDRETAVRFIGIIDAEATRLNRLSEDLLSLARLENRGIRIESRKVKLRKLVEQIVKRYGPLAAEQGRILSESLPEDLPAVYGDKDWLSQVIINLMENAIKYSGNGSGKRIWIEGRKVGDMVEIAVADEGIGIPDREKERVFGRFYRVDKGRSRDSGGTGLGLSIVKHVVEAHGGTLGIKDRTGGGTEVWFRIPAVNEEDSNENQL